MKNPRGSVVIVAWLVLLATPPSSAIQVRSNNFPSYLQAPLNYEIVVPKVIYFRVGSPGNTVDEVVFDIEQSVTTGNNMIFNGNMPIGDGTSLEATSTNLGGKGVIPVEIRANSGQVAIGATVSNSSGLTDGNGHFINYDQIETISSDAINFPAPVLANSGITAVSVTGNEYGGLVTNRTTNWTFRYRNQTVPAAGTYTGTVTYTASVP